MKISGIYFKPWGDEPIISNFCIEDWRKIHPYIESDIDLRKQLAQTNGQCFVFYNQSSNSSFGFILCLLDGEKNGRTKISLHGGAWTDSALQKLKALMLICDTLFSNDMDIRTSCTINNVKCHNLLTGIGFVNHYTSTDCRYYWLPYKRFVNSTIYKRFHN